MIRNIPNKYTQQALLQLIDVNHAGTYDFFYLPIDFRNKCNLGYAFLNFKSPISILSLVKEFAGKRWERFRSEKVCEITYARIQGKQALIEHFRSSRLMHKHEKYRPIVVTDDGNYESLRPECIPCNFVYDAALMWEHSKGHDPMMVNDIRPREIPQPMFVPLPDSSNSWQDPNSPQISQKVLDKEEEVAATARAVASAGIGTEEEDDVSEVQGLFNTLGNDGTVLMMPRGKIEEQLQRPRAWNSLMNGQPQPIPQTIPMPVPGLINPPIQEDALGGIHNLLPDSELSPSNFKGVEFDPFGNQAASGGPLADKPSPMPSLAAGRSSVLELLRGGPGESDLYAIDPTVLSRGLDPRTTVMIRNIPNKYTQQALLQLIDVNHAGTYDFFYLPIDFRNKCNLGYAFLNFKSPISILSLVKEFAGKRWERFRSEKVCEITYARIQGKQALIEHFRSSRLMHKHEKYRPLVFCSPEQGSIPMEW